MHLLLGASTFLDAGIFRHATTTAETEVDDVLMTLETKTPATGLSAYVALEQSCTAPNTPAHGTLVSFAGLTSAPMAAAQVAVFGARVIDLPGSVPRGAPV